MNTYEIIGHLVLLCQVGLNLILSRFLMQKFSQKTHRQKINRADLFLIFQMQKGLNGAFAAC